MNLTIPLRLISFRADPRRGAAPSILQRFLEVDIKSICLIISVLLWSTALWAQGEGGGIDCSQATINGSDTGCSETPCNGSVSGCSTVEFTAACTGTYNWDVWTSCTSANCKYCNTCSYIYENGQPLPAANCHTDNCNSGHCTQTCAYDLQANHRYVLYVCLYHCPVEGNDCTDCDESCTAHACLRYSATATCY